MCVPTFHKAAFDILERNEVTERERERVFAEFARFARDFMARMRRRDSIAFVDFVGLHGCASESAGQAIFDEVMSAKTLCGYKLMTYCGVTIVDHPDFGYRDLTVHSIVVFANPIVTTEVLTEMLSGAFQVEELNDSVAESKSVATSNRNQGSTFGAGGDDNSLFAAGAAEFVACAKLACGEGSRSFEAFKDLSAKAASTSS